LVQGPVPWEEIEKMSLCTPRSWMDDHDSDISDPDSDDRITIYTNEPSPTPSEMLTKSVRCKLCFTAEIAREAVRWPDDLRCTSMLAARDSDGCNAWQASQPRHDRPEHSVHSVLVDHNATSDAAKEQVLQT
jgi:hypothetical protein